MDKTDKKKTVRVKTAVRMPSNQSSDVIVRKVTKPRVKKMTAHKETHPTDYHEMKHKEGKSESESDEEGKKEKKPKKPRVKKERSEEQREADKERMKRLRELKKKKE